MPSGFEYRSTPVENFCSLPAININDSTKSYTTTLKDNGFHPDETVFIKYSTEWLDGKWASTPADFAPYYKNNNINVPFCKKGYAPLPLRNENSGFSNIIREYARDDFPDGYNIRWTYGKYGQGVYITDENGQLVTNMLDQTDIAFISRSPVIVLDINAPGGGGGGGSYQADGSFQLRHRHSGGSGGSGAFASLLIDVKKVGRIVIEGTDRGSGGSAQTAGKDGDDTTVKIGSSQETLITLGGGKKGTRGHPDDDSQEYGSGGDGGSVISSNTNIDGCYILCTKDGLKGTNGTSGIPSNKVNGYSGLSYTDTSRNFGNLFTFTTSTYSGGSSSCGSNEAVAGPGGAASAMGRGGNGGNGSDITDENRGLRGSGGGGGAGRSSNSNCDGAAGGRLGLCVYSEKQHFDITESISTVEVKDNTATVVGESWLLSPESVTLQIGTSGWLGTFTSKYETSNYYNGSPALVVKEYIFTFSSDVPDGSYDGRLVLSFYL